MTALRWGSLGASDVAATRKIPAMPRLGHEVPTWKAGCPRHIHQDDTFDGS